jgi:hypothetical protein
MSDDALAHAPATRMAASTLRLDPQAASLLLSAPQPHQKIRIYYLTLGYIIKIIEMLVLFPPI